MKKITSLLLLIVFSVGLTLSSCSTQKCSSYNQEVKKHQTKSTGKIKPSY